jgi:hypothetical protein
VEQEDFVMVIFVITVILIFSAGCATLQPHGSSTNIPIPIITTIHSTDWLASAFMVVVALGVAITIMGLKSGIAVAGGGLAGSFLKAALSVTEVYWVLGALFIATIVLLIAATLRKNKAIVELVRNIQCLRLWRKSSERKEINCYLTNHQNKDTRRIVQRVKMVDKLKGL